MLILKHPTQAETWAKNSRFLAEAIPVSSPEEAKELWKFRKDTYDNGGPIVYAFATGANPNILGCSDDGEPSGTAGRPVLAVLKGSGITNCLITVARWFGGTKLGTGGLVHAYSSAAVSALKDGKIVRFSPYRFYKILASYSDYQKILPSLSEYNFRISDTVFLENVEIFASIPSEGYEAATDKITEISSARVKIEFIEEKMSY